MLADTQTAVPANPTMSHWIEAAGLAFAYGVAKLWETRSTKKQHATTKVERNAELDQRLTTLGKNLDTAISVVHQSNTMEFGKLNTRFDKMEGTVDSVAGDVKGLKERELARLESDAAPTRRQKR